MANIVIDSQGIKIIIARLRNAKMSMNECGKPDDKELWITARMTYHVTESPFELTYDGIPIIRFHEEVVRTEGNGNAFTFYAENVELTYVACSEEQSEWYCVIGLDEVKIFWNPKDNIMLIYFTN